MTKFVSYLRVSTGRQGQSGLGLEAQREHVRQYLGTKQAHLFPLLRQHVRSMLSSTWFREDIGVAVTGSRADTIRLTAPQFARNSAIEDLETAAGESFLKARFRRVEYRWSPHWNEGHHYDLRPPADNILVAENAVSDTAMVAGFPAAAYDLHTREGRLALGRFSRECRSIAELLRNVSPTLRDTAIRHGVFIAEGGLLREQIRFGAADAVEYNAHYAELAFAGINDAERQVALLSIIRERLPNLNHFRSELVHHQPASACQGPN